VTDYDSLYEWSVRSSDQFWALLWDYCGIVSSQRWDAVVNNADAMPGASWFDGARLNFAENLLKYRDDQTAIVFQGEGQAAREITYARLYAEVARCADLLKSLGVSRGDRVAGYMTNNPEAVIAMLATSSIGAIWSSCSPDFGVKGVLERFTQIEPRVLFTVDGYRYNGKNIDVLDAVESVVQQITSIEKVIVIPFLEKSPDISRIRDTMLFGEFHTDKDQVDFVQLPFDHPLYILYSSGTTGKPKCIVHSAGGTLVQHLKEHQLHTDIKRNDRLFYFTTCGWMMWNWLVSGLASGCTIVLYDGSPFYPGKHSMWEMVSALGITVFGTSARFIAACAKTRVKPIEKSDLSSLRAILSTGSPLVAESYDYVYQSVKKDVMLSSISGGTDIVSCFVLGNPVRPVYRGEIQCRGLGMAVDVYEDGVPVREKRGELVCTKPFPSMPLGFWNEPDNQRYHDAYFARFENVWAQGDYAEITKHDGLIIYGRSDAVLNPGGIRIGTAEIYRQVEKVDEVMESLCIAQQWDGDVRIVLFVQLREGSELTMELKDRIRRTIQENTTRRHVPKKICAVPDIPRTLSGKIVELAVRNVVHGDEVKNTEALANPESLGYFRNIRELQEN
jgi:acetoacetyl-CoA synthetase